MIFSLSENNGIAALSEQDLKIYSVGISTGGAAEMRMAWNCPTRRITATTIDREGAAFARKKIGEAGLLNEIEVKVEDVAKSLPYSDDYFDFIYARLVLHYLPKSDLIYALSELHRILKAKGKIFVVVRSFNNFETPVGFDPQTGMTTYTSQGNTYSRHFHTEESIQDYLASSGFLIENIQSYEEQLCVDFQRKQPSPHLDKLVEAIGTKKSR